MAPIEWSFEARVAAPPGTVYAWLSDYREDDHARPAFFRGAGTPPGKRPPSRRAFAALPDGTLQVDDAWGRKRFRSRVTLDPGRLEVRIRGDFGYESVWRAAPAPEGSRVSVTGRIAPRGIAGALMALGRASFLREMETDFNGHIEDLRDSLRGGAPTAP